MTNSTIEQPELTSMRLGDAGLTPPCPRLGRSLGRLKITPPDCFIDSLTQQPKCLQILGGIVLAAIGIAGLQLFPNVPEFVIRLSIVILSIAITTPLYLIPEYRLKHARTVEVFEGGLKFTDPSDAIDGRHSISWEDVDPCSVHTGFATIIGFSKKSKFTLEFCFDHHSSEDDPCQLVLTVKDANEERKLAEFISSRFAPQLDADNAENLLHC